MKEYSPRAPGFRLAQGVDMGKLFANAVKLGQTITAAEVDANLLRSREEYLRRSPNSVPPSSDD